MGGEGKGITGRGRGGRAPGGGGRGGGGHGRDGGDMLRLQRNPRAARNRSEGLLIGPLISDRSIPNRPPRKNVIRMRRKPPPDATAPRLNSTMKR